jgi:hypothetical protein
MARAELPQDPNADEAGDDVEGELVRLETRGVGECTCAIGGGTDEGSGEVREGIGLEESVDGRGGKGQRKEGGRKGYERDGWEDDGMKVDRACGTRQRRSTR